MYIYIYIYNILPTGIALEETFIRTRSRMRLKAEELDLSNPLKEGYLYKQSNNSWKKRFFVLKGTQLVYFSSQKRAKTLVILRSFILSF